MKPFQDIFWHPTSVGLLSAGILLVSGSALQAQEAQKSIGRQQFLEYMLANHPNMIQESINSDIALQDKRAQQAGQEWELQVKAQQAQQQELLPSFGPEKVDQSSLSASIGRPIWKTGARFSIAADAVQQDNSYDANVNQPFPSPTDSETQQLSLTLSQPLLKNFMGSQSRLALDLSDYNVSLVQLQVEEQQEQFIQLILDQFLDWVSLEEELRINKERLALAKRQSEEINKRLQRSLVEKVDWLRTRDSERLAEQQLLLSQSRLRAKREALANLSNYPELALLSPDFDLYDFPKLPELARLLDWVAQDSRRLAMVRAQEGQLQRQLKSVEDRQKAELNLDLSSAVKKEEQSGLALGQPDNDDGIDYSIGLHYRKKLGNKAAKSELQKLQLQLDQNALAQEYLQMEMRANIQDLYIQLKEMRKVLALNADLVATAEEITKEEYRVYQQGRSDLTNVISSRDQARNTHLQYARNAITYHRLFLQLESLTDRLLARSQDKS